MRSAIFLTNDKKLIVRCQKNGNDIDLTYHARLCPNGHIDEVPVRRAMIVFHKAMFLFLLCSIATLNPVTFAASMEEGESAAPSDTVEPSTTEDVLKTKSELNRQLRTVEEDVNRLKERVFRSKSTLQLLKELLVEGASIGSRVVVWHINRLSKSYRMESVQYSIDGKGVFGNVDPGGALSGVRELKAHEQTLEPGSHTLQVDMVLRGDGFGIFSYLRTYQFKVQSNYTFEVEDGRVSIIRVVANEQGGLGRTFVERPTIHYEERVEVLRED